MKHEPIILPTTAAVTTSAGGAGYDSNNRPISGGSVDCNATLADKVLVVLSGVTPLANTETVLIYTRNSQGALVPVYTAPGSTTQAQLTGATGAVISSIVLEGGFIYAFVKSATAAASGVDVYFKRASA